MTIKKYEIFVPIDKPEREDEDEKENGKSVQEDHWLNIAEKLYQESGEIPDPIQIRSSAIIKALDIPSFETCALEKNEREKNKIIAEYLTNKEGVFVGKNKDFVSLDFRDIYPDGLPEKLKQILDPDTLAIMEAEYKQRDYVKKRFGDTRNFLDADCPTNYFRLPGGIDVFMRGYIHCEDWQRHHGHFIAKANKSAQIICLEGYSGRPLGKSLDLYWSSKEHQEGDYDTLMKEAIESGFQGLFTEIDARDRSKIDMDHYKAWNSNRFPNLPLNFFKKYFEFLKKENPSLIKTIDSPEKLKQFLEMQSTTLKGVHGREKDITEQGKIYTKYPYISKKRKTSFKPTYLELGQHLFTDAMSAIKLHLIAKLMADKHIEKGPIIDYQGDGHSFSKSFFLKYPEYAVQIVLRTVNELMAGKIKEKDNISEIYKNFENPEWNEIVKEITKLAFKKIENNPEKSVDIGANQKKLIDEPIDFLKTYDINPDEVVPSDKKIEKIRKKIAEN